MSIARNLRRKQARKENHNIFWKDCSIPAKLFFEDVIKGNYHVLGNAPESELQKAYWSIIDEYVILDKNDALKDWFKRLEKISVIEDVKAKITDCVYLLSSLNLTEELQDRTITALNSIEFIKVRFDKNKGIQEEIIRINNEVIGELDNEIEITKLGIKTTGEQEAMKYELMLSNIQDVHGYWMPEDLTLRMFLAKKQTAIEKTNHKNG